MIIYDLNIVIRRKVGLISNLRDTWSSWDVIDKRHSYNFIKIHLLKLILKFTSVFLIVVYFALTFINDAVIIPSRLRYLFTKYLNILWQIWTIRFIYFQNMRETWASDLLYQSYLLYPFRTFLGHFFEYHFYLLDLVPSLKFEAIERQISGIILL